MACTPGILKILYPLCIVSTRVLYPWVQAKTPEICKIPEYCSSRYTIYGIPWPKLRTAVFKISKISIDPSPRNGISAETSKTLLILYFLATGAGETNKSDFGETGFFTTSSCKLEVSAKGL